MPKGLGGFEALFKPRGGLCISVIVFVTCQIQACAQQDLLSKIDREPPYFVSPELFDREIRLVNLQDVPFFPQTKYQCGPAAVATIANFYHRNKSLEEISEAIFLPGKKGSLQVEIIAEFRSMGLVPYPLAPKLESIITEVEAGAPVLVLQNLGTEKFPLWHYTVVVGFNMDKKILILNSGKHEHIEVTVSHFNKTWVRAGQWAIVAVPTSKLPATADLTSYISAVTDMEEVGELEWAYKAYLQALRQWPDAKLPLVGLGNVAYRLGDYRQSMTFLLQALAFAPEDGNILNNLAYAYARENCFEQALSALDRALELQPNQASYLASKREIKAWQKSQQNSVCRV